MFSSVYELYFDGACFPNPGGEASFGYALYHNKKEIDKGYGIIGHGKYMTDITAEYYGLSQGLSSFVRLFDKPNSRLEIYGDSLFVIKQIKHIDKPRHEFPELVIIDFKLEQIKSMNVSIEISWIPRSENHICDRLAKLLR